MYDIISHTEEAYILNALLSFARRYWRKAVSRGTKTAVAEQLKVVLKPNPRRTRQSCRKTKKQQGPEWVNEQLVSTDSIEAIVHWEF